jgi:hypothetical protein
MDKARRILVGGWMDTAVSVFTRGYYLLGGEGTLTYETASVRSPQLVGTVNSPQLAATVNSPQASGTVRGR